MFESNYWVISVTPLSPFCTILWFLVLKVGCSQSSRMVLLKRELSGLMFSHFSLPPFRSQLKGRDEEAKWKSKSWSLQIRDKDISLLQSLNTGFRKLPPIANLCCRILQDAFYYLCWQPVPTLPACKKVYGAWAVTLPPLWTWILGWNLDLLVELLPCIFV